MKLRLIIFFSVIILSQLIIGVFILKNSDIPELDMVKINELSYSCSDEISKKNIDSSYTMNFSDNEYDYAVFDNNSHLLYTSISQKNSSEQPITLNKAIKRRDTIIDLSADNNSIGKLVIINDYTQSTALLGKRLALLSLIGTLIILISCVLYTAYIHKVIFKPFNTLKDFANRIAHGNLDIPLTMDKNNIFGAFTESFDLMRDELKRAKEKERLANQSKKELVAQLSHDIKTPIASIRAIAEVMEASSANISEKQKEQLGIIESKADQIDSLISNLFNATLEELQELKVNPIEQSSKNLKALIEQADYMKKVTVKDIPECLVMFDSLRLQQVFDNILSNSYKYANTNIDITALTNEHSLIICIQDYGDGIPKDELPLVFNKFYRCKNADGHSGAGLGLYISRYLINQMGGDISFENNQSGLCTYLSLQI